MQPAFEQRALPNRKLLSSRHDGQTVGDNLDEDSKKWIKDYSVRAQSCSCSSDQFCIVGEQLVRHKVQQSGKHHPQFPVETARGYSKEHLQRLLNL
ncbi:hypothetical protein GRJ2_001580500 [Grus japonensis]|uniref:Uncharacterized protein n=1 Tax=Grus japonensis TaxID=30415 RepID=A0ABC9X2L8_GRUJA